MDGEDSQVSDSFSYVLYIVSVSVRRVWLTTKLLGIFFRLDLDGGRRHENIRER